MDVPSTEYKYNTLPAKTGTNANVQRFSIAQVADTHSLPEISVIREDLAKQKPLLDKRDPLKRISCVFPPEFQPSFKLSKSLNDLQEIKPEPPVPNPRWLDVRSEKEPPSNQESHVAGAKENSSIEKVGELYDTCDLGLLTCALYLPGVVDLCSVLTWEW